MQRYSCFPSRCWAEIDLAALERNLKKIRDRLPAHMRYVAVVKADAYGHGIHQVAARLMHAGVDLFAVANLAEAAALREVSRDWPILLLSPLLSEEDSRVVSYDVAVTVSSVDEVRRLDSAAEKSGGKIVVHLKVDTGMGRLGVWHERAHEVYKEIRESEHLKLAGIFTHFANPDEDPAFTHEQRKRFVAALARCEGWEKLKLLIHADNSAGLETIELAGPFNAVRVGLLQFGVLPRPGSLLSEVHTEPVFTFKSKTGLVKDLPKGVSISYGQTYTLKRDSRVAIITGGYGDGISRALSNKGQVLIHGVRCPILGRVTMDQTIVDVSEVPDVRPGDEVVLIGSQGGETISLAEFSKWADTIPWETLCSVTKRVPRRYKTALGL